MGLSDKKKKESTKSPDTVIEDMNLSALAGSKPVRLACSDGHDNGWKESLKLLGGETASGNSELLLCTKFKNRVVL